VSCTESNDLAPTTPRVSLLMRTAAVVALGLTACASPPPPAPPAPAGAPARAPAPAARAPAERPATSIDEYKRRAALRIVQANPESAVAGQVGTQALAVPVLEIEVNADGSVRRINVFRAPRVAPETVDVARRAVERAAPFGDARGLPRPWTFLETFLFVDETHFKPLSLNR